MTQASIEIGHDPATRYMLRIADTCLMLGQRLAEWCGHGPVLEEDIALANMALDLIGQARALYTHAGRLGEPGHDEDQLAFLRDERDYLNPTIAELPRGDFAFTVLRNAMLATLLKLLWERLQESSDSELAGIAGKALKEARYHQRHAADWVVRLAGGTDESRRRIDAGLAELWRYGAELFESDAVEEQAAAHRIGPRWADLREPWLTQMKALLDEAGLPVPRESAFRSSGKLGRHSEHMGYLLADLQYLQRSFPGGVW